MMNSEVPITTTANGLIARSEGCAAWVDAVYLYSSFLLVRTCLILRPDLLTEDPRGVLSLVDAGFDLDGPPEVQTTATVDTRPFSTSDATLEFCDAEGSTTRAQAVWMLPTVPRNRLEVDVLWPAGGLRGSIAFDATGWVTAASAIHSI